MEKTPNQFDEHVVVTPPDKYWSDSFKILLVDFDWGLAETIVSPLASSPIKLAIHIYRTEDRNYEWLLDTANNVDIVIINLTNTTESDIIKGNLISKEHVWYVGRNELNSIWSRHTDDPLSKLLVAIDQYQHRGNK